MTNNGYRCEEAYREVQVEHHYYTEIDGQWKRQTGIARAKVNGGGGDRIYRISDTGAEMHVYEAQALANHTAHTLSQKIDRYKSAAKKGRTPGASSRPKARGRGLINTISKESSPV